MHVDTVMLLVRLWWRVVEQHLVAANLVGGHVKQPKEGARGKENKLYYECDLGVGKSSPCCSCKAQKELGAANQINSY